MMEVEPSDHEEEWETADPYADAWEVEVHQLLDGATGGPTGYSWYGKGRGSRHADAISDAQVQSLGAAGGIAALTARGKHQAHRAAPTPRELRGVPDKVIITLFGSTRAALMRLTVSPDEALKAFSKSRTCALLMEKDGYAVPDDALKRPVFFHFQVDHFAMLRTAPIDLKKVEEWFYGFARWAIDDSHDDTRRGDFAHIRQKADNLLVELVRTEAVLVGNPGSAFRATVRQDGDQLITHFSTFRTEHVRRVIDAARSFAPARHMLPHFELLERAYIHLHAALPGLISGVFAQIAAQGKVKGTRDQHEEYVSRATIAVYRAFVCGLSSGEFTPSTIKLSDPTSTPQLSATGGGGVPPPVSAASPAPPPPYSTIAAVGFSTAGSAYNTVQAGMTVPQHPPDGPCSLDGMARQVAHGYRVPGAYVGPGGSSGATEGTDLTGDSRKILFAHQVMQGLRLPGYLAQRAPMDLPPVAPFAAQYVTTQIPQSPISTPSTSAGSSPGQGYGGPFAPGGSRTRPRPLLSSDELHIPYSIGLLGSRSPYRSVRVPDTCYECNALNDHFAHECPSRFLRVRGELPPGWRRDGSAVLRDASKWIGQDLTDAARAEYGAFLTAHALTPHPTFPVSADEITGPQPAQARQPARRRP